jgi:hypothetical protein
MPHSEKQRSALPRVDVLTEASARDPEVVLIERLPSGLPADEHNADQLAARTGSVLDDAEPQEQAILAHDGGSAAAAPARSVRRATRAARPRPHERPLRRSH